MEGKKEYEGECSAKLLKRKQDQCHASEDILTPNKSLKTNTNNITIDSLLKAGELRIALILFCNGISMAEWALRRLGWEKYVKTVFIFEILEPRNNLTKLNFTSPNCKMHFFDGEDDLKNLDIVKIDEMYQQIKQDSCDLVISIAGPPCQPFSDAGRTLGPQDERANVFRWVTRAIDLISRTIDHDLSYGAPKFAYIIENVVPRKNWQFVDFMIQLCHSKPYYIEAGYLATTRRSRLYFTNFDITLPLSKQKVNDRRGEMRSLLEPRVVNLLRYNGVLQRVMSLEQIPFEVENGEMIGEAARIRPFFKVIKGYYCLALVCPECEETKAEGWCYHAMTEQRLRNRLQELSHREWRFKGQMQSLTVVKCKGYIVGSGEEVVYYRGLTPQEKINFMGLKDMELGNVDILDAAAAVGDGFSIPVFMHIFECMQKSNSFEIFPPPLSEQQIKIMAKSTKAQFEEQSKRFYSSLNSRQALQR